jgi:hypothetical protein
VWGFIFVKFVKTTLGAVATLKIAEILLMLGPNKTRLDATRDLFAAKNISKQGLALRSTEL